VEHQHVQLSPDAASQQGVLLAVTMSSNNNNDTRVSSVAATARGLHQPISYDDGAAPNMNGTPRSVPPNSNVYDPKEMSSDTHYRMRDMGAAMNTASAQGRYTNYPMQGDIGFIGANTKEEPIMASYAKETPIVANYLPPHVRLRLHQRKAAASANLCQPDGVAAKQLYGNFKVPPPHTTYYLTN
jgi:hypothetical protein